MIVIDASAVVEALVGGQADESLYQAMTGELCAPHLLDTEVLSVLRGLHRGGRLSQARAEQALIDYADLTIRRYEVLPLAQRIWALRHQYTAYDAAYLALAEALAVPLVTCDRKLRGGGGTQAHHAEVIVLPAA